MVARMLRQFPLPLLPSGQPRLPPRCRPIVLVPNTLPAHVSCKLRQLIAAHSWLTVFQVPTYAPELNPVNLFVRSPRYLQLTVIRPTQDPRSWHKSCPVTRLLHWGSRVRKCMLALRL
jgi:hypothetical protein